MKARLLVIATACCLAWSAAAGQPVATAAPVKRYILVLQKGADVSDDEVQRGGGTVHMHSPRYLVVSLTDGAAAAFAHHKSVKYMQRSDLGVVADSVTRPGATAESFQAVPMTAINWSSGDYAYDGAGNISAIGTPAAPGTNDRTISYAYDLVSRLVRVGVHESGVPDRSESYSYDPYGNLIDNPYQPTPVDTATNRFSGWSAVPGTAAYSYDENGSVTGIGSEKRYYYDPYGLLRVSSESTRATHFIYTPSDERIGQGEETVGHGMVTWTWTIRDNDNKVLRQYASDDPSLYPVSQSHLPDWIWLEDYAYREGGQLIGAERVPEEGGRRHFHVDHLGTPRLITGPNGEMRFTHEYSAFGVEVTSMRPDLISGYDRVEPLQFTGHERDNKGDEFVENTNYIDYMHARNYSPVLGRFLSVYPELNVNRALHNPQGWNRYTYVENNPIGHSDPTGRCIEDGCILEGLFAAGYVYFSNPANVEETVGAVAGAATLISSIADDMERTAVGANGFQPLYLQNSETGHVDANAGVHQEVKPTRDDIHPGVTQPYKRPANATTPEQRKSVQNQPCGDCGQGGKMNADHKQPLVKQYYKEGALDMSTVKDVNAVRPQCPTCSASQGGFLSQWSKAVKEPLGF